MSLLNEDNYLMLSGLQHWTFCKRQCGLIHLEQCWSENRLTLEGQDLHQHVDEGESSKRGSIRTERGISLVSHRFMLIGRADVVEFHRESGSSEWKPFPVEYKRGKPKAGLEDKIQLCAQAFCLEEQLNCDIPAGALFYGQQRRRQDVPFNTMLRDATENAIKGFHEMMQSQKLPSTEFGPKCQQCSLHDICMPETELLNVQSYFTAEG